MAIRENVTPAIAVDLLNEMVQADRDAAERLLGVRVTCNASLADHHTIQVRGVHHADGGTTFTVGLLGVLNGIFGVDADGWGCIAAHYEVDDDGNLGALVRFSLRRSPGKAP